MNLVDNADKSHSGGKVEIFEGKGRLRKVSILQGYKQVSKHRIIVIQTHCKHKYKVVK